MDWQWAAQLALEDLNLWPYVDGTLTPTTEDNDGKPIPNEKYDAAIARKALRVIARNVSKENVHVIRNSDTAYKAWTALRNCFEKSGYAEKFSLWRRLLNTKLNENEPVDAYVKQIRNTLDELAMMKKNLPAEDQVFALLAGLPPSFETIISTLEVATENLDFEYVVKRLYEFESRKKLQEQSVASNSDNAMFVKTRSGPWPNARRRPPPDISRITCFKCGKKGHYQSNCPLLQDQGNQSHANANVAKDDVALHLLPQGSFFDAARIS